VVEWNEYLNWEIAQWTKAILGALPAAGSMGGGQGPIRLQGDEATDFLAALSK